MTEQEMRITEIEKMTKIARDTLCNYECRYCGCTCEYYDASLALYDAGYRKKNGDSVVLSKEEYQKLTSHITEDRAKEIFMEEAKSLFREGQKQAAKIIITEIKKVFGV